MTFDRPGPVERASRIWPIDNVAKDNRVDGPVMFLKLVFVIAWRYKLRLLACMFSGVIAAALYAHSLPRTYDATATILLEPRQFANASSILQQGLDLNSAESELQIILSERLLSAVFESLKLYESPELAPQPVSLLKSAITGPIEWVRSTFSGQPAENNATTLTQSPEENLKRVAFANFVERVSARRVGQSYVVAVGYWSTDPTQPARVANAIISGYILQSVTSKEQVASAGTETLQGRLDALSAQIATATQAMKEGTLPKAATPDADAKITGAALPPLAPSSPKTSLIVAFGGVLGLFFGMAALAMSIAFDRKVRSPKDLETETTMPCMAQIPEVGGRLQLATRVGAGQRMRRHAAAIRDLRTLIDISYTHKKADKNAVIALAGYSRDAGGSALALNLADMLNRSGRPATVFWCGEQTRGVSGGPLASLADAAISEADIAEITFEQRDGIAILPVLSRDAVTNIYSNFRHPRIREIIEAARQKGDVIIDLPELDSSLDALALASQADVVVLVTRWGRTTREAVKSAEQQLRRAGANLVGYIINRQRS
ncbi:MULTISPECIES: Wzz/FepE/Etk N-terminal domain-containing protein [Rhizobiaceae]|uniref:Mrp family chromosome partitioning ATPase n=1 Tax=Aliirhizobium cellulosilyticum TaxID=393664 RepID=A0A7W6WPI2_9HYPH|nr:MULTISPECIES: Wzz/FepE/Etk N-terminal domain-containing protein [Rhizobium/Agrobacterium group]MBB4348362.1 Mrp family chromosome partitioning ATPase [Rhizobium cellulosilyticum]MBB4411598.1 Mrp family chromosome partitioning ATPase [Rhizobium cellulosilyticum]MBB4446289.1 Mrp family chromosome partitioning ATPase [Rhizobium cellulosilyticum]MBO0140574.1 exopolysaccharide biosynthesis protein [Agrobacterium sp. Ap1]